jgi:hypothetical protein
MGYFETSGAVRVAAGESEYQHRFGGSPMHAIVGKAGKNLKLHCIYVLDTTDPALPQFARRWRWLPLYYPFFNNACEFAYEVLNDNEIHVHLVSRKVEDRFPYPGFPNDLAQHSVRLLPLSYEEQKTLVYAFNARGGLCEDALSDADRQFLGDSGYPFSQIGGIQNMTQGVPERRCANPRCEYAKRGSKRTVFAVVWNNPVPNFQLWGEFGNYVQLIFQICPECATIYVCNRCD